MLTATPVGKDPSKTETKAMAMIYMDICGPIAVKNLAGEQYLMTLI